MKIKLVQTIIDSIRIELDNLNKAPFKLFYIGSAKHSNAGDMFNKTIMNHFKLKYIKTRMSNANIFNLGSILDQLIVHADSPLPKVKTKECVITGAGFMHKETEKGEKLTKNLKVYAVRGKLTKNRLEKLMGKSIDCVLADPGILLSYIYPYESEKKYKVGIIPHFIDKKASGLDNINLNKYNCKIINIEQDIESLYKEINECECILSSSLHGLVFADSYNIPNRQIILSDKILGGLYKYQDYYSAYDMELPKPIDLRKEYINDNTIDNIMQEYIPLDQLIKVKQQALVKIYKELSESQEGKSNNDKVFN